MKESVTYQAIVEEGKLEEARQILLRLGNNKFNRPPKAEQSQELEAITDIHLLENLIDRVLHVRNWSELLESPTTSQRRRKKS